MVREASCLLLSVLQQIFFKACFDAFFYSVTSFLELEEK